MVILMMSVMLCLWPASFSIAEPVAKGSLHTKDHRLSRSDEPSINITGIIILSPEKDHVQGQTGSIFGKNNRFLGPDLSPKKGSFFGPQNWVCLCPLLKP